jgi:hypothetical protein
MPDDRAVGEHEQRLGHQRPERGHRQREDLTAGDVRRVALGGVRIVRPRGVGSHAPGS